MNVKRNRNGKAGFTFVELVMAVALSLVVAVAVLSAVTRGADIWRRSSKVESASDIAVFFDKFSLDLRNCLNCPGIGFIGVETRVEFPSTVTSRDFEGETIGKIIYAGQGKTLTRIQLNYSGVYTGTAELQGSVLTDIKDLRFIYYVFDSETAKYSWVEQWKNTRAPLAVRAEIIITDGEDERTYTKTVTIPVGG